MRNGNPVFVLLVLFGAFSASLPAFGKMLICVLPAGLTDQGVVGSIQEGFSCRYSYIKSVAPPAYLCPPGYELSPNHECSAKAVCAQTSLLLQEEPAGQDVCRGASIPVLAVCPQASFDPDVSPFLRRTTKGQDRCFYRAIPDCAPAQTYNKKSGKCDSAPIEGTSDRYLRLK